MKKYLRFGISALSVFVLLFIAGFGFASAEGSGIFLTLHAKKETKNPDIILKGKFGEGASVSVLVNGENAGAVSLSEENKYHIRVPLSIGNNVVRVVANREGEEKVIEKNITRKAKMAYEKPLWISIVQTKNRIRKPDMTIRGKAYGVSEISLSVNGVFQGTVAVSAKTGKFKFRAAIDPGVNHVEAEADNGTENVTATKRVRRI